MEEPYFLSSVQQISCEPSAVCRRQMLRNLQPQSSFSSHFNRLFFRTLASFGTKTDRRVFSRQLWPRLRSVRSAQSNRKLVSFCKAPSSWLTWVFPHRHPVRNINGEVSFWLPVACMNADAFRDIHQSSERWAVCFHVCVHLYVCLLFI